MSGNSAARLKDISVKLTSECRSLSEDTDLKDSVLRIVKDGQNHVNTWNYLMRQSLWGLNQQKEIIMKSSNVHDVNNSAVLNALSKMMDSVRSIKDIESSYICKISECADNCRYMVRRKQEMIEEYRQNIADLECEIMNTEETNRNLQREAVDFETLADRLAHRARELDDMWFLTKVAMAVIGTLLIALTAGLILTVVAVAFLSNFNLNTASGCRDGARESRKKATEKKNEIVGLQSINEARRGKETELQNKLDRATEDIAAIEGIERELRNLMQVIRSLNIQRSSDHVIGLLQNLQSCAAQLTSVEEAEFQYRLQNFKVKWNTMERGLIQCSTAFSDFVC